MVIWYYNHYSGGIGDARVGRSYYLAKALKKANQSPVVITASFHHLLKTPAPPIIQRRAIETKNVDGINFIWLKTPFYKGNGVARLKNMLAFAIKAWRFDLVKMVGVSQPDVIIISSVHPFHLISGLKWSRKYKAKLIFEVRDLWPLSLQLLLNLKKWHPLNICLTFLERLGYRKSDLVISPLKNAVEYMGERGLKKERFLYLPNGFIKDFEWASKSCIDSELEYIRTQYRVIMMHTGSMGIPNGLEIFITAANTLVDNHMIAFVLIGNGDQEDKLKNMAISEHVYFFDKIPKEQVLKALSFADICYCGSQNLSQLYKFGVSPNKIFDYMLARKPVLLGIDSPGNPIELAGAGFSIKPNNVKLLGKLIVDLSEIDHKVLEAKGQRGFDYLHENHDFDMLATKLINKLESSVL